MTQQKERFLDRTHEVPLLSEVRVSNRQIGAVGILLATVLTTFGIEKSTQNQPASFDIKGVEKVLENAYDHPKILTAVDTGKSIIDKRVGPDSREVVDLTVSPISESAKKSKVEYFFNFPGAKEELTYGNGQKLSGDIKSNGDGSKLELLIDTDRLAKNGDTVKADVYEGLMSVTSDNKNEVEASIYVGSVVIDADNGKITSLKIEHDDKIPKATSVVSKMEP